LADKSLVDLTVGVTSTHRASLVAEGFYGIDSRCKGRDIDRFDLEEQAGLVCNDGDPKPASTDEVLRCGRTPECWYRSLWLRADTIVQNGQGERHADFNPIGSFTSPIMNP
jgi:hypothetical protein